MKLSLICLSISLSSLLLATTPLDTKSLAVDDFESMTLEELLNVTIVSSTGTSQKLSQAPSIATVITAKQIERSSARTLQDVLRMVPGLETYLSSAEGQQINIDIRGIKSNLNSQILTLLNGVSIDSLLTGSALVQHFPASAIERIEVIRGPGSAVYGADAFAGVINIITKDAEYLKNNSQVGLRYGSFNTLEAYGNYGEVYENGIKMGLNLSYSSSDGDNARVVDSDLQTTFDGLFGSTASLSPEALNTDYALYNANLNLVYENFSLNLWARSLKRGTGAGVANALDNKGEFKDSQILLDLNHDSQPMSDVEWNNKLSYLYQDIQAKYNIFPSGAVLSVGSDGNLFTGANIVTFTDGVIGNPGYAINKYSYESTLTISSFTNHKIRLSTGYSYATYKANESKNFGPSILDGTQNIVDGMLTDVTGTPYIFIQDETRKIFFLSAQDTYSFVKDWSLTTGIRYDNYSDFGDTINPRIGLVWNTSQKFTTKLLYGRAFRAPAFAESYVQNNPISLGNRNLAPETINMLELGTTYRVNKDIRTSFNLYWYEAENLIRLTKIGNGQKQFNNIGHQDGAGVEIETSYQATGKLLLSADYAYRWTHNAITKQAVAEVPIHLVHAMFDYSISQEWFINSEVFYTADIPRELTDSRAKIKDYAVVNLSTAYKTGLRLEALLAVRNLLDEQYVNPSNANPINDYPMQGINIFAELKYRF
ncbi:TonB-dependent receptor [Sulfurimonas sp. SAG-AH-194-C21]|nr:TonB-dependent receptor [Sulfurimonas sp. SAG-AH-194-C21]MDF1883871.1 TonB-dependent receptor [Sulfurimonas sp. SAG-AH-194-C21]